MNDDTETEWYHAFGHPRFALQRERLVILLFTRARGRSRRVRLALAAPKLAAAVTRRSAMHTAYRAKSRGHRA